MPKKNDDSAFTVKVEPPAERKKTVPRSAYSRSNPSPHQFEAGVCPNPGGRAGSKPRLLSKALKARLDARAPDRVCTAVQVPVHSTWATVLASALVGQAVRGDVAAARMIAEYTEPLPKQSLAFGFEDGEGEESGSAPRLTVNFVSTEYTRAQKAAEGKLIDVPPSPPHDVVIDPEAAPAQQEAETVEPRGDQPLGSSAPPPRKSAWAALATPQAPAEKPTAQQARTAAFRRLGYPI